MPLPMFLPALLAGGVLAAIVPTGVVAVGRAQGIAAALPAGAAAWSVVLTLAAYSGTLRPAAIGAIGWAVAITLTLVLSRRRIGARRPSARSLAAVVALALVAALYAGFPSETMLGNRDEGLYSLTAPLLLRTGGLSLALPAEAALAPELVRPFFNGQWFFLPGIYQEGTALSLQFPALLPAWIAQVAAATGGLGLFRASALFALCGVVVFHALARRIVGRALALVAAVAFAVNPAQVWIARVNLVEPLAQLLVLGGLLLAVRALDAGSRRLAAVAGAVFGVATFGRLDAVVLAPLVVGAFGFLELWGTRAPRARRAMTALAASTLSAQAIAVALLALATPDYVADNRTVVIVAALAVPVALAFVAAVRASLLARTREPVVRSRVVLVAAVVLVALFVYAAAIRPHVEPFAVASRVGSVLDGTRDFRERSLLNLAAYVGWPVVVAALAGAVLALRRVVLGRARSSFALVAIVVVAVAIGILANPRISPDHFWAVRRFVPLLIPGTILLATYALRVALAQRRYMHRIAPAFALAAGVALLAMQWPTLLVRENRGLTAQVGALNEALGSSRLVLTQNLDVVATPLMLAFGRPLLPLRDGGAPAETWRRFWSRCTPADPCVLLDTGAADLRGFATGPSRELSIERETIAPTTVPLPDKTQREVIRVRLTPILGLATERGTAAGG